MEDKWSASHDSRHKVFLLSLVWNGTGFYGYGTGRLVVMGRNWRLSSAASMDLLFISRWYEMWTMVWWYWLGLTPNLSIRALWQPPVLSGGPAIRDISGGSGRVGEGNENLVYPFPWDFKKSFACRKILRHGTSGFTSHPKEGVLRIFIALKNPSPWPGSNP
jgi:hypothetical protein